MFFFLCCEFCNDIIIIACEHRLCITLYSKREDRNYRETALKIDTFSASLKLSHRDIQRLNLPEGYVKKYNQADKKRRRCIASNEIPYFLICPKVKLRLETFDIAIANSG